MNPDSGREFESGIFLLRAQLSFTAEPSTIEPIIGRIMGLMAEMNCAEGKEFEIEASLREALVNAIVHGCKRDSTKRIECCVACDQERGVLLIVRDPGPGFDPNSIPSPLIGENIFAAHGRGIYLINQLMDEVSFKRGGTEIHMRKK